MVFAWFFIGVCLFFWDEHRGLPPGSSAPRALGPEAPGRRSRIGVAKSWLKSFFLFFFFFMFSFFLNKKNINKYIYI